MNLFSILEEAAEQWPERTAVVHDGRSFLYAELYAAAESVAFALRKADIQPGDKVALMCANSPEYIVAFFAALKVGAVVIPIPPALKRSEVAELTTAITAKAYCFTAQFNSVITEADGSSLTAAYQFNGRAPLYLKPAAGPGSPNEETARLQEIDAAVILWTSGTTSAAKGLVLSHGALMHRVQSRCEAFSIKQCDSILWLLSMAHAVFSSICAFLSLGAKIITADAMKMRTIPECVAIHRVRQVYAAPLFYRMAVYQPEIAPNDLPDVPWFISATAELPKTVAEAFRIKFGREIAQYYGLSETGALLTNFSQDTRKRGSVGTMVRGYEIELTPIVSDPTTEEEVGEISVRGPGMFDAYYQPWRLRDEVLEDGWFRTGDVARRDVDGYYWIVGRTSEVINVGGVKVFPHEVEEILLTHPAIDEAVVFGAPEPRFGEAPRAKIKLRAGAGCTAKEILQYANEQLSVFKALRAVEFVDEIPKTVTGKPRRRT